MQAVWMFRLLVRYVQLLPTNLDRATMSQRTNATSVLGRMLDHAGRMDVQAVGQVLSASSHQL